MYPAHIQRLQSARFALYDAERALSAAIAAWQREGEDEQRA